MPAATAQDAAGSSAGQFPVVVYDLAIHDGEVNAIGKLVGFCESGMIDDGCGVENGDVCKVAGLEEAAALEAFPLGWERSDLANRGFEGQQVLVADVTAEEARHGAHCARMGVWFVDGSVERHFASIEADAGPRLAEADAEVFFTGHEIDRAGLRFVGKDEIH